MGIAFYTVMKMHKGLSLLLFSFLYASFVHGIFDAIIFNGLYFIFLIILLRLAHSFALSLLNYSTAISPFRETIKDFVLNYSNPEKNKGLKCINCGSKEKKDTYKFDKIQIQKCDNCASYVTTRDSLYYIFHHFGSNFKNLTQYYKNNHIYKNKYSVLFAGNSIDEKSGLAYFNLDELGNALEDFNKKIIKEKEDKWWFPQLTA